MTEDEWVCRHFSIANPKGRHSTDLPRLLRTVATEIERRQIDAADLLDVTISQEMTDKGPWWSAAIYWSPDVD